MFCRMQMAVARQGGLLTCRRGAGPGIHVDKWGVAWRLT